MSIKRNWFFRVLLTLDQSLNVILFNGGEDHTISGRVGHKAKSGGWFWRVLEKVINALFWFDPNHCKRAVEQDEIFHTTKREDLIHILRLVLIAVLIYAW